MHLFSAYLISSTDRKMKLFFFFVLFCSLVAEKLLSYQKCIKMSPRADTVYCVKSGVYANVTVSLWTCGGNAILTNTAVDYRLL